MSGDAATPLSRGRRRMRYFVVSALSLSVMGPLAYELMPRAPALGTCPRIASARPPSVAPLETPPVPSSVPAEAQAAAVVHVVDGDGICVRPIGKGPLVAGRVHEVRLIGINAPGTGRCWSSEASAVASRRIGLGTTVFLSADVQGTDRYGRVLRYVWDAHGDLFNLDAVRLGAARALVKAPNERYEDPIRSAEAEARRRNAGMWRCFPWRLIP
jgi:micrococcal nuclease